MNFEFVTGVWFEWHMVHLKIRKTLTDMRLVRRNFVSQDHFLPLFIIWNHLFCRVFVNWCNPNIWMDIWNKLSKFYSIWNCFQARYCLLWLRFNFLHNKMECCSYFYIAVFFKTINNRSYNSLNNDFFFLRFLSQKKSETFDLQLANNSKDFPRIGNAEILIEV